MQLSYSTTQKKKSRESNLGLVSWYTQLWAETLISITSLGYASEIDISIWKNQNDPLLLQRPLTPVPCPSQDRQLLILLSLQ